jgi:hypothetical protein
MGNTSGKQLPGHFNVHGNPFDKIVPAPFYDPVKKQAADNKKKIIHDLLYGIGLRKNARFPGIGHDPGQQGIHVPGTIIKKRGLYAEDAPRMVKSSVRMKIGVITKKLYQVPGRVFVGEDLRFVLFEILIYLFEELHKDVRFGIVVMIESAYRNSRVSADVFDGYFLVAVFINQRGRAFE